MLGMVTFAKHVEVLERYCKGDIFTMTLFSKIKVLKGLILHSVRDSMQV